MKAKNFQELERLLNGPMAPDDKMDVQRFAEWLDEHGYKTFPDAPDYVS